MTFLPGDIFLVHGKGFVSNAIRFLTRRWGEPPTKISHVGLIVDHNQGVEALSHVRLAPFRKHLGETVEVFRPLNLDEEEIERIVHRAKSYVGKPYGYLKIVAHALDGLLCGVYLFRRLTQVDSFPICSWLVAHAYHAAGKDFGVSEGAATPDDIDDFVRKHREKFMLVHSLRTLTEEDFDA